MALEYLQLFQGGYAANVLLERYFSTLRSVCLFQTFLFDSRTAESSLPTFHTAATCIQRHWRGWIVRAYHRRLHELATLIQRHWRGHATRKRMRNVRLLLDDHVNQAYREQCAIRIQSAWRGYSVRRNELDFKKRRDFLRQSELRGQELLAQSEQWNQQLVAEQQSAAAHRQLHHFQHTLTQLHHLLSTDSRPGVLHNRTAMGGIPVEEKIRSLHHSSPQPRRRLSEIAEPASPAAPSMTITASASNQLTKSAPKKALGSTIAITIAAARQLTAAKKQTSAATAVTRPLPLRTSVALPG